MKIYKNQVDLLDNDSRPEADDDNEELEEATQEPIDDGVRYQKERRILNQR